MGHDVLLWALEPEVVRQVNEQHENATYFKVCEGGAWRRVGVGGKGSGYPGGMGTLSPASTHTAWP